MMKKLLAAAAMSAALAAPQAARAQATVGPIVGVHEEADFGVGAYLGIPVPSLADGLSINPSFTYFFPGGSREYWEINGDVVYDFGLSGDAPVVPFALAGLNVATASGGGRGGDTDLGLNLGGGVTFATRSARPLVGGRFEIGGGEGFVVFAGVGFPVGG